MEWYSVVNLSYFVVRVKPRGFPRHAGPAGAQLISTLPLVLCVRVEWYRYSVVNLPYSVVRVEPRGFPRHAGPAGAKLTSTLPYRIGCSSSRVVPAEVGTRFFFHGSLSMVR